MNNDNTYKELRGYLNDYKWMDYVTRMPPLIITIAVNGGIQGKELHPMLPEKAQEIAEETYKSYNAGASIVHIHPRNPKCLWDCTENPKDAYTVNKLVRKKCNEIIINNSTGGGMYTTDKGRIKLLEAAPELASLNMGPDMGRYTIPARSDKFKHPHEELFDDSCWAVTYGFIDTLVTRMNALNIKPEMELYHNGQYWVSRNLIANKMIEPPYYFQFVMGYQTGVFPTPQNLIEIIKGLPENSVYSTIGIGKFQWVMTAMSIFLGGHVRVGLEDNLYLKKGIKLRDNAEAVERIVSLAKYFGREIATPEQARVILGLNKTPKEYK
jgi:3-keto-5-aminohexanoate cleavage enzyme